MPYAGEDGRLGRDAASELTSQKVEHLLTVQVRQDLDLLLRYDAGLGMTSLAWLTTAAVEATASAVRTSIEKLVRRTPWVSVGLSVVPVRETTDSGSRSSRCRETKWQSNGRRSCNPIVTAPS